LDEKVKTFRILFICLAVLLTAIIILRWSQFDTSRKIALIVIVIGATLAAING
jgi:uncharacterized membrane protein